jgi:hypothetical protein
MTDDVARYVTYLRHHAEGHPEYLSEAADILLALKARAEAAEKERDDLYNERHLFVLDTARRELQARAEAAGKRIEILMEGLEIIAGRRQCIDNLMSNADVAIAALEAKP